MLPAVLIREAALDKELKAAVSEIEIRSLREQVKKAKEDMIYFYLRTKDGDAAFRRKNNCTIYSDNAGVRWWFKYRDSRNFYLPYIKIFSYLYAKFCYYETSKYGRYRF